MHIDFSRAIFERWSLSISYETPVHRYIVANESNFGHFANMQPYNQLIDYYLYKTFVPRNQTVLCKLFRMSMSQGMQAGLLLAQGGEFAFVAFRLAESLNILSEYQAKVLLTSAAITMALTPAMSVRLFSSVHLSVQSCLLVSKLAGKLLCFESTRHRSICFHQHVYFNFSCDTGTRLR
mgnify:CR=1 FL=1